MGLPSRKQEYFASQTHDSLPQDSHTSQAVSLIAPKDGKQTCICMGSCITWEESTILCSTRDSMIGCATVSCCVALTSASTCTVHSAAHVKACIWLMGSMCDLQTSLETFQGLAEHTMAIM